MEIETARLRLRRFTIADLDDLAAIRADRDVMRYIGTGEAHTREQVEAALKLNAAMWEELGFSRWAVMHRQDETLIGWCGLAPLDKTTEVEIGYGMAKSYWGRGLTTEAARATLRHAFEGLGLRRITAVAYPDNTASQRVMEKIGMKYEKIGRYYDADLVYYAINREDYEPDDSPYTYFGF